MKKKWKKTCLKQNPSKKDLNINKSKEYTIIEV